MDDAVGGDVQVEVRARDRLRVVHVDLAAEEVPRDRVGLVELARPRAVGRVIPVHMRP